jgi:DNA-binding NarL/FixJ family response regulator
MPQVEVIGEAGHTHEAMDLFRLHKPEIVVVSVALPSAGGFNVLRYVKQMNPECDVILTLQWRERFVEAVGLLLGATAVYPTFDGAKQICALIESRVRAYGCV